MSVPAARTRRRISGRQVVGGFFQAASLTTSLAGANNDLKYTAKTAGVNGNNIRVRYVVSGASTPLTVSVSSNDITVNVATDGSSNPTSTATQVKAAVDGSGPASALVSVANAGSDTGAGTVAALAFTNLSGGSDWVAGQSR